MSLLVKGNTSGLASSELRRVEKFSRRKISANDIISFELARELYEVSLSIRRQIALLISREGQIEEIIVGTKNMFYLPDLGRYRLGKGRLRRLRLVYADLSSRFGEAHISKDVYTDLEKLRLDAVVSVKEEKNRVLMTFAHIIPKGIGSSESVRTEKVSDLAQFSLDFRQLIESLEEELADQAHRSVAGGALLVGVYSREIRDPESRILELRSLAETAGVEVAGEIIQRRVPDPKTLLGKGKLEEILIQCIRDDVDLLIFDGELRPSQWRVITNSTDLKVIDRSMLILDIFAQRAQSNEGR
ncbi:MAG: GTPase HflX, partial [SAR324 cluster bacterium]|nr:GTPase HflX [SAR324 cluster bacterium]